MFIPCHAIMGNTCATIENCGAYLYETTYIKSKQKHTKLQTLYTCVLIYSIQHLQPQILVHEFHQHLFYFSKVVIEMKTYQFKPLQTTYGTLILPSLEKKENFHISRVIFTQPSIIVHFREQISLRTLWWFYCTSLKQNVVQKILNTAC